MKRLAIIMRHADYLSQLFGDGPLTTIGRETIEEAAYRFVECLKGDSGGTAMLVLVSGSIRGLDTHRELMRWLHAEEFFKKNDIFISDTIVRCDFYSTPDEGPQWRALRQREDFKKSAAKISWDEAVLLHGFDLVKGRADCVVQAVKESTEEIVLIINHSPHDRLIVEGLTGTRPTDALELGKFRIVEFE